MLTITLPSFAKINWTLEILGRRPDGYHELRTILQTISLRDELRFSLTENEGIEILCDVPGIPTDECNLVHRAARLLATHTGITPRVRIELVKRIPAAGGLGGGSGNAAITLIGLQKLWNVALPPRELFTLAAQLGADVPCFLLGGTMIGIGRGDEIYPLADVQAEHLLLVNAGIAMPTAEVYGNLPAELTKPLSVSILPFSFEAAYLSVSSQCSNPADVGQFSPGQWLRNDLERPVYARHPVLAEIRNELKRAGAVGAMMSGSGSTIFAVFETETALIAAETQLQKLIERLRLPLDELSEDLSGSSSKADPAVNAEKKAETPVPAGWWTARARTLGRNEYHSYFNSRNFI